MELYHIHRLDDKYTTSDLYHEGSTFEVGKEYNSLYKGIHNRDFTYPIFTECKGGRVIESRKPIRNKLIYENISKLNKEDLIELLEMCDCYLGNVEIDRREQSLEKVRSYSFPTRPSRYRCMWLTDEESLDTWIRKLRRNNLDYELYKVAVEGNIFASTNNLLPQGYLGNDILEKLAYYYWNPKEEDLKNVTDKEILFEGQVRLIKRVK